MREPGFIKRAPRVETHFETSLTDSDGGNIPIVVLDISREGCRMESDGSLKIGEMVQIQVPKYGTFSAQIRWALGNEAGAVFLDPIALD